MNRAPGINDELYGMLAALQVALPAIVKTHPDPDAVIRAFREEHEETIALLTAQAIPESAIDAYRDFLHGVWPNKDDPP